VRFRAADLAPYILVLEGSATATVLATAEAAAPPLVDLQLPDCRYRNALYRSRKLDRLRALVSCSAVETLRADMRFRVSLNGQPQGDGWAPLEQRHELSLPLPAPLPESLTFAVALKGVPNRTQLARALRVVPPAASGREVTIGADNETLVDGKPFFPAGFYGMPDNDNADPIPRAGFTAALTYGSGVKSGLSWLDACKRLGLLGMVSAPHPFVAEFDEAKLRQAIRALKSHPALLAYYLFDEPAPHKQGQTPADLKRVYDVVADEDPYHPVAVCLNVAEFTDDYADCCDVILPDPYPLLKVVRPLTYVSDRIDVTRQYLRDLKPIWIVPQAFGWNVIRDIEDPERYRTPTPAQERCMTYLALTRGVQGVMYYCYHVVTRFDAARKAAGKWPYIVGGYLPDQQAELWRALAELGPELRALGPALLRPAVRAGNQGPLFWRVLQAEDAGRMLIAVNTDPAVSARVRLPHEKWNAGPIRVRFGNGQVTRAPDGLDLTLPALGTVAAELVDM